MYTRAPANHAPTLGGESFPPPSAETLPRGHPPRSDRSVTLLRRSEPPALLQRGPQDFGDALLVLRLDLREERQGQRPRAPVLRAREQAPPGAGVLPPL